MIDTIYNEDCLVGMQRIQDSSIDCIICDLPYGTTGCKWDKVLDFDRLWSQYKRIIKEDGAIVLFSQQPFTSLLISSNIEMYRYSWLWVKDNASNFIISHLQPLRLTEDICVFGKLYATTRKDNRNLRYYPQMRTGFNAYKIVSGKQKTDSSAIRGGRAKEGGFESVSDGSRYPINLLYFNRDADKQHPTQKPVALIEYLIRTYTKQGDTILDNCIGSGTTAVAAINTNRHYIGFELNKDYYNIATERVKRTLQEKPLFYFDNE